MSESNARLTFLFNRYYSDAATDAEISELMELINASDDDQDLARLMKVQWDRLHQEETHFSELESDRLFSRIVGQEEQPVVAWGVKDLGRKLPGWLRYAAAVALLLLAGGVLLKFKDAGKPKDIAVHHTDRQDIKAGGNKAILTLSDGATVLLDSAGNGLIARQGTAEIHKKQSGELVYGHSNEAEQAGAERINTISTPKGGTYQITLPDGSHAWLNAASSISFPVAFAKAERRVKITGEVYFEVEKDKTRPFKVSFDESEVQVFGTSFNIMAYGDEKSSFTTLVEGSIALRTAGTSQRLTPGQQAAILPDGKLTLEEVDVDEATAWKKGLFFFKDAAVETVMNQAARWYDVEIIYEGKIPVRQLTGKVSRNVNISELMSILNYTGVKCRVEGRKVVVSP